LPFCTQLFYILFSLRSAFYSFCLSYGHTIYLSSAWETSEPLCFVICPWKKIHWAINSQF
jgi:hypothetical protein